MLLQESNTAVLDAVSDVSALPARPLIAQPVAMQTRTPAPSRRLPQNEAAWALDIALDRMIDDVLARDRRTNLR